MRKINKMRSLSMFVVLLITVLGVLVIAPDKGVKAANPYLPLWEHLPDGEPRVFEDPDNPGKYRAYIYGSHDLRGDSYCGPDVRVWSAPVEDLNNWRDEGPIFTYKVGNSWDVMYAPDIAEVIRKDGKKEYYLYPHSTSRTPMVCKGDSPVGPFTPINLNSAGTGTVPGSLLGFDPGIWIDYITDEKDPDYDIGFRAYAYWGFQQSYACELDQNTMYSSRDGKSIRYFMPSSSSYGVLRDPAGTTYPHIYEDEDLSTFNFFEASSIRKVGNKYVMIYSGYSGPDYGLGSTNSALRYCYGDTPLGPWRSGGVLVDSRAPVVNENGNALTTTNSGHNTHGSILEINGQWYVFYHRPPRGNGHARQPMVAPIKITYDEKSVKDGGKVVIRGYDPYSSDNTWTAKGGNNEYTGAEVTSEGFEIFGLDPYKYYSVGIACYFSNAGTLQDNFDIWDNHMSITDVANGHRIGFKYFGFGGLASDQKGLKAFEGTKSGNNTKFNLFLTPKTTNSFKINVWMDGPWDNGTWNGTKIGEINVPEGSEQVTTKFTIDVSQYVDNADKKHAIFLTAEGSGSAPLCDLIGLGFSSDKKEITAPTIPTISISVDGMPLSIPETPIRSTSANGITGYDIYTCKEPESVFTSIPVVTASSSDKNMKITISQALSPSGMAVVRFNKDGVVKTYRVPLSATSNYDGSEVPDVEAVEQAANIIGNSIILEGADAYSPQEKAAKAKLAIDENVQIKELDTDIEVSYKDGSFTLKLSKGNTSMTINSFFIYDLTVHTINLNANGGTLLDPTKASFEVKDGDPVGNLPTPLRSGFIFKGWFDAITGGTNIVSTYEPTGSMTLYARWEEEAKKPDPKDPEDPKDKSPEKGSVFSFKNIKYKVLISAASTNVSGVVQVEGLAKSSLKKSIKTITIPITVKSGNFTFKVEAIKDGAFSGCPKVTKVTIGKNVTKIGKKVFYNNKKLKTINIQCTKLKSVGNNAFKNIHQKAKIKVPSKMLKKYKKLLGGKGQKKTVKIIK